MTDANGESFGASEARASIPFRRPSDDSSTQPFRWQAVEVRGDDLQPRIRVGTKQVSVGTRLQSGAVVVLDQELDEPVEIVVRGEVVATGHVVVSRGKLAIEIRRVHDAHVRKAG